MDIYALYEYSYCSAEAMQGDFFDPQDIKVDMSTEDKNLWLDRLFGKRNTDVKILRMKKKGGGGDKFPCKVLNHGNRVVWLRLENEKIRRMWMKHKSATPQEPETISKEEVAENPFSHIFLDCRAGRSLIAIMKENDAWRDTDVEAHLLEESLGLLMQAAGYGFGIKIEPVSVKKDYWDYNRQLILKDKLKVRKMTIYFGAGTLNPQVMEYVNQTPILKRLLKEMWEAKRGRLELDDPLGQRIVDRRKRDVQKIIEMLGSNLTSDAFGLSLSYEDGREVVFGKDVRLMFQMKADTFSMLFAQDLFGEYEINKWLDGAVAYIKEQKDGTPAETSRKRKAAKHVRETSATLDLL